MSLPAGHSRWDVAAYREIDRQAIEEWRGSSAALLSSLLAKPVAKRKKVPQEVIDCLTPEDIKTFRDRMSDDAHIEGSESARERGRAAADQFLSAIKRGAGRAVEAVRPPKDRPKDGLESFLWWCWVAAEEFLVILPKDIAKWVVGRGFVFAKSTKRLFPALTGWAGWTFAGRFAPIGTIEGHASDIGLFAGVLIGILVAMGIGEWQRKLNGEGRLGDTVACGVWGTVSVAIAAQGIFLPPLPLVAALMLAGSILVAGWGVYDRFRK